ncbi:MAG: flagellar hook-length control protein FliK [Deltaproteobacteria bacterium]|nr:flagellar hook-length control protein FliK [Deltaproteobacteria bacterium]
MSSEAPESSTDPAAEGHAADATADLTAAPAGPIAFPTPATLPVERSLGDETTDSPVGTCGPAAAPIPGATPEGALKARGVRWQGRATTAPIAALQAGDLPAAGDTPATPQDVATTTPVVRPRQPDGESGGAPRTGRDRGPLQGTLEVADGALPKRFSYVVAPVPKTGDSEGVAANRDVGGEFPPAPPSGLTSSGEEAAAAEDGMAPMSIDLGEHSTAGEEAAAAEDGLGAGVRARDAGTPGSKGDPPEAPRAGTDPPVPAALRTEAPGRRLGVERLWGYWLRRSNAVPNRVGEVRGTSDGAGEADGLSPAHRGALPTEDALDPWVAASRGTLRAPPGPDVAPLGPAAPQGAGPETSLVRADPGPAAQASAAPVPAARAEVAAAGAERAARVRGTVPPAPAEPVIRLTHLAVGRQGDRITVHLEPESLGKVQLVVSRDGEGLVARFRVETPEAHQALVAETPMLRRELEAQGMTLVRVSVDLEDGSAGGREPRTARRALRRGTLTRPLGELSSDVPNASALRRTWGFDARV